MALTRDEVEKVALLARLRLSDAELAAMAEQLGAILEYVAQLAEVDTTNVEPLAHCQPIQNAFRDDQLQPSLPPDQALANAPKRAGGFFAVPAILD